LESRLHCGGTALPSGYGAPRSLETDTLRSVVLERRGEAIHFHPRFLELSAHYHFAPRPCNPRAGWEKGRVERTIQYVRHSFFAARPTLLCIDEIGYLTYDSHAADLLFEIVNHRYARNAILLTTNKGFKNWNTVFPNATSIAALLDRLTHHADVTLIEGTSYRVRESELEAAARKKQKCEGKPHAQ
jgi:hypothetical protein